MQLITESYINGAFKGWSGDSIFEFVNGQIWKQSIYRYKYRYKYRPLVRVWSGSGGYFLEVDGDDEMLPIKRLR